MTSGEDQKSEEIEIMTRIIFYKEVLDHVLSLRFIVGFGLCLIVSLTAVIILTHDYERELADYNRRIAMQDDFLNNYAHTNRLGPMMITQKPPEIFRPLVIGMQEDADLGSFDDNPLPILFPPLDFIFIVTIIMSLMAILFSYDAVCGEKERGTLKLMLSTGIPRANILAGKWLGGSLALLMPFLISMLAGAVYITLHPGIQWTGKEWLSFFLLIVSSLTFISVFYLMGLMVSALTRFSSVSILTSLFFWVLFVLAIPNLSPYLAAQFYRIPSVNRIEKETNRLQGIERDELGRQRMNDIRIRYEAEYGSLFTEMRAMTPQAIRERIQEDSSFEDMYNRYSEDVRNAWREANRIQGEKANRIRRELELKADVQTWIAKHIACLSPYANFVYLATDLTGTGMRGLDHFNRTIIEYFQLFSPYLERRVQQAREEDPTFHSDAYINLRDRPRHEYHEEAVPGKLVAVLPYWGILCFFNVLFFLLAFNGFIKYDVR